MTKVLVTGGTGFIGQFLIPQLMVEGYEVYNVDQYFWSTMQSGEELLADVNDIYALTRIYKKVKPDIVIHLAAITAVAYSYEHPIEVISTNFLGTVNLAEAGRMTCPELKQFIYPSSAEVYGITKSLKKKESDVLYPNSPYAVSKEASERYLKYMYEAYGFPVTIFRPFNSYGRLDNHWFIIEKIVYQMLKNQKIVYLGDPEPVRDFLYVADHINAYIKALNNPKAIGETFNLSTGEGVSIKDLAGKIAKLIGWKGKIKWQSMPRRPLDIMSLVGDNQRIRTILNWDKPISLDEGLKQTIRNWRKKLE